MPWAWMCRAREAGLLLVHGSNCGWMPFLQPPMTQIDINVKKLISLKLFSVTVIALKLQISFCQDS